MQPLTSSVSSSSSSSSSPISCSLGVRKRFQFSDLLWQEIFSGLNFSEMIKIKRTCKTFSYNIIHLKEISIDLSNKKLPLKLVGSFTSLTTLKLSKVFKGDISSLSRFFGENIILDPSREEIISDFLENDHISRVLDRERSARVLEDPTRSFASFERFAYFAQNATLRISREMAIEGMRGESSDFGDYLINFEQLPQIPSLTYLHISGRINMINLATFCPNLEHLTMEDDSYSDNRITDDRMKDLRSLIQLKSIELIGCCKLTNRGITNLNTLTGLRELRLLGCGLVDNIGMETISNQFKNLERLSLLGCQTINNWGITQLKKCIHLKRLELIACSETIKAESLRSINPSLIVNVEIIPANPYYTKLVTNSTCYSEGGLLNYYSYSTDDDNLGE